MTRPGRLSSRDRWSTRQALSWIFLGVVALSLGGTGRVSAAEVCAIAIADQSLAAADDPSRPVTIRADATPEIRATSPDPVDSLGINIEVWPLAYPTSQPVNPPTAEYRGAISVAQFARFGSGLYEVTITAGACEVSGWVKVVGPAPYQTVLGIVGIGAVGVGLLFVTRSILAARRGGSIIGSIIGGAIVGIGLLLLAQQTGTSAVTPQSAAVWTIVPAALGGIGHTVTAALSHAGAGAGAGATVPTPPSPTPPPTTTAPTAPPAPVPPDPTVAGGAAGTATAGGITTAAGAAGSEDQDDVPRSAFARLECPDAVVAEVPFGVVVGLAKTQDTRVIGDELIVPETVRGHYTMTIQLIADGMRLANPDGSWRVDLPVTKDEPYPAVTVDLLPDEQQEQIRATTIRAMYSINGNPIGLAIRSVAIVRTADLIAAAPTPPPAPGVDLALPAGQVPPDLTVRIERAGPDSGGRLLFQLLAADRSIDTPDAALPVDVGDEPANDLQQISNEMQAVEGKPTQFAAMRGIALTIADRMPIEFWDVLRRVAALTPERPPTVLFLSAEPYVPWELALVDPPLDPAAPPFLSAQATVGRWVLGQRRPPLPPPMTLTVNGLAAVSGIYELPGWQRLVDAEAEAADLVHDHRAEAIVADTAGVLNLLRGKPQADVIHFAVHGTYDAAPGQDGLILIDGETLDPLVVLGTPLYGHPFVFLNACQVGQGDQLLGDQAGLAAAFLSAGASAVIAPLWSIDDQLARGIAARFYERALRGEPPAEIMRTERAAFLDDPATVSSTYLAYQYFGHPGLRLEVPDGPG